MTFHIKKDDYQCPECSAYFIPYQENHPCPNCGHTVNEPEYTDFIDQLLHSLRVHKRKYGQYMPDTWLHNSFGEHVQQFCFQVFDDLERKDLDSEQAERKHVQKVLDEQVWQADMPYVGDHVSEIVERVYEKYLEHDRLELTWWQRKKQNFFERIKKFLP
jgi:uncharacterized Zn finger protein (UPF0148 family)